MTRSTPFIAMAVALSLASSVSAALIPGFNGGFESPGGSSGYFLATGWQSTVSDTYYDWNGTGTEGLVHQDIRGSGGYLFQNLGATIGQTIAIGDVLTASFDHRADRNNVGHTLELWVVNNTSANPLATVFTGGTLIASISSLNTIPALTWATTSGGGTATASGYLAVRMSNNDQSFWGYYDNVTLDLVPVPEPASLALVGLGGLLMLRRRS